jgi:hypothetical protein
MVIITKTAYPTEAVNEIAKRFLELPPIPDYFVRRGPYVSAELGATITVMTIFELDKSKLAEGMEFISERMTQFFDIPGFTYEFKPWQEVEEALKMIGMG